MTETPAERIARLHQSLADAETFARTADSDEADRTVLWVCGRLAEVTQ